MEFLYNFRSHMIYLQEENVFNSRSEISNSSICELGTVQRLISAAWTIRDSGEYPSLFV
jgi:hypothetical protein